MIIEGIIRNGEDPNGSKPISIDKISRTLVTTQEEHSSVHDGNHYVAENFLSIADGATASIIIVSPDSSLIHLVYEVYSSGTCNVEFREAATANLDGTVVVPKNNNRTSSNISELSVRSNPTVTVDGTTLISRFRISSIARSVGNLQRERELILNPSTKYQIRIINLASAANIVGWSINYYEQAAYN